MGFQVVIDGRPYEVTNFQVQEAATPLAAGDSSGQVGTISVSFPAPNRDDFPNHDLNRFGPQILNRKPIRLIDTTKGFTLGEVTNATRNDGSGTIDVQCVSRLGKLNVYNVQAQPFIGTLEDAFRYYLTLANQTVDIYVDPSVASRQVTITGWKGELWLRLKELATAQDCDVSLVSGNIVLRPIRERTASRGRFVERGSGGGLGTLAQSIEIYHYKTRRITNELVYPPGGWTPDVGTINVDAGSTTTETLELSASVSSIQQPVMQVFVSRPHDSSSVFTVVGDDGFPIMPAAWEANGGSLEVSINPDTTSLTVTIVAPTGLYNKDGNEIGVYSVSLSSDFSTGRYSTLRIVGTGVAYDRELVRIPTGVPESQTGTEVGVTIDNPFFNNLNDVYRAGVRAAKAYSGAELEFSASVLSVNSLGDTGDAAYPSYEDIQALFNGKTYAEVEAMMAGKSYAEFQEEVYASVRDNFENQVFGNVNGARIWDDQTSRWYRVRTASISPSGISITAEDDLTHADIQARWGKYTYGQLQEKFQDRSYFDVHMMGAADLG